MDLAPVDKLGSGYGLSSGYSPTPSGGVAVPFAGVIDHLLERTRTEQATATQAIQDLALGKTDNIHNVMLAVSRADLSFRFILEIRNRLSDAMQEVLKMQI